jgi:hypothetical protein
VFHPCFIRGSKYRYGFLLFIFSGLASAFAQWPLYSTDVLLYVPFDGTNVASIATGSGVGTPYGGATNYVDGAKGQALVVNSSPMQGVDYSMTNNLVAAEGTVAMWLQPLDWQYGDGKFHYLLSLL